MVSLCSPHPFAFALAGVLSACLDSRQRSENVHLTSTLPPPGSVSVSRRVEILTVFDQDVDPASANTTSCLLVQHGAGPAVVAVDYAPGARLLTLTPQRALQPFTTYRVLLTLRTASGVPFAHDIEWSFTTNGDPVWDRAAALAAGTLLSCEPSRRGGLLALWAAPDTALQFAHYDGTSWSPRNAVGISNVFVADVADDETGRVVVAANAHDGNLHVAFAPGGTVFAPAEIVAAQVFDHVDVDAAASGHVAVGWTGLSAYGHVRLLVPNVGWAAPYAIFGTRPHVHLEPAGHGVAACAFAYATSPGPVDTSCLEYAVEPNGSWTLVDPPLPSVYGCLPLGGSKARFGNGRILVAPTVSMGTPPMPTHTPLFERTALGWWEPGPQLGADPRAFDVALGPSNPGGTVVAAATFAVPGLRPTVEMRFGSSFSFEILGAEPASAYPLTGVAITTDARVNVLWTAAADDSPDAPVRLLSAWRLRSGAAQEPLAVDGPFPAEEARLDALRVIACGTAGAIAVWSRQGIVRFSVLR